MPSLFDNNRSEEINVNSSSSMGENPIDSNEGIKNDSKNNQLENLGFEENKKGIKISPKLGTGILKIIGVCLLLFLIYSSVKPGSGLGFYGKLQEISNMNDTIEVLKINEEKLSKELTYLKNFKVDNDDLQTKGMLIDLHYPSKHRDIDIEQQNIIFQILSESNIENFVDINLSIPVYNDQNVLNYIRNIPDIFSEGKKLDEKYPNKGYKDIDLFNRDDLHEILKYSWYNEYSLTFEGSYTNVINALTKFEENELMYIFPVSLKNKSDKNNPDFYELNVVIDFFYYGGSEQKEIYDDKIQKTLKKKL